MNSHNISTSPNATYSQSLMLILFQIDDQPQLFPGVVIDMTVSTIRLLSVKPIQPKTKVILHLELLENKPAAVYGVVKWSKSLITLQNKENQSPNFIQEIEFINLSKDVAKIIATHVCNRLMNEIGEQDPIEIKTQYLQNRNYLRIPITLTIFCRDGKGSPFSIITEDLSGGGTRFTTTHSLSIGERIYLQIQLDLSSPIITVMGKIIWLRKLDTETHEGGLEFTEISVQGRTALVEYLAKTAKQSSG